MENKKNPEVDLERKKSMFFFVGLAFSMAAVLVAIEWKTFETTITELGTVDIQIEEEEMIPITQQAPPPPPPPPPPPSTQIEIVEDDAVIEEEVEIETTEVEETTTVDIVQMPAEAVVESEPEVFLIVEDPPSFPGGEAEMFKFLGENLKYPPMARDAGIQGIVYVEFIVMEDGAVSDVKVLRGIGGGCDEAAVDVVKKMPKWNPGKQRGQAVRVRFRLPIRFTLN
ncbi:MAG: energy transducer TonB [Crocinitomicaceae bacterium]|nr:energy transducer TonB [Crocinitomicaceae bacterium]|tara:strand:- start:2266 stop:2943 length:678 start_codon:yes stop_codon:yes gene_type:complete